MGMSWCPRFPLKRPCRKSSGPLHHVVHTEHGHVHPHPVAAICQVQQLPQHELPTGLRPSTGLVKGGTAIGKTMTCGGPWGFRHVESLCCKCKYFTGWWYTYPSEKYESQLGWWNSQYMENINVPNHQPEIFHDILDATFKRLDNPFPSLSFLCHPFPIL